ncbi:MAG: hypothetical protein KatS3mg108_1840 [Isosphaeraceae bacterium]|jgi:hypothetical protein|nr:MAG: hypothetical protein KatS3mg108_1840 [Isosphaeraceae bacterium]
MLTILLAAALGLQNPSPQRSPAQPPVQPGPAEPDWLVILDRYYATRLFADLANPVQNDPRAVPGLFRKASAGPVRFVPELALGLEVTIRGGYYYAARPDQIQPVELWRYRHKSTARELEQGTAGPPPLDAGSSTEFDPGDHPFGLYIANDQFDDAVYTEPAAVAQLNPRLAGQPYKAMIYPYRDPQTGQLQPNTYLIGWEYSTNDDFQDVVCRVENVILLAP